MVGFCPQTLVRPHLTRAWTFLGVFFPSRPKRVEALGRVGANITLSPGTSEAGMEHGVADSEQLQMLSQVVSDHCRQHGIRSETDREQVAIRVLALFRQGLRDLAQISDQLERVR